MSEIRTATLKLCDRDRDLNTVNTGYLTLTVFLSDGPETPASFGVTATSHLPLKSFTVQMTSAFGAMALHLPVRGFPVERFEVVRYLEALIA